MFTHVGDSGETGSVLKARLFGRKVKRNQKEEVAGRSGCNHSTLTSKAKENVFQSLRFWVLSTHWVLLLENGGSSAVESRSILYSIFTILNKGKRRKTTL